jgi:hypothetical protein
MTHVISRRPLTAEAHIYAWVSPCGICGGQNSTGIGFSLEFFFPCQYHSTMALHSYILLVATVQRYNLTPST